MEFWKKKTVVKKRNENRDWLESIIKDNSCPDAKIEISRILSGPSGKRSASTRRLMEYDFLYSEMDADTIEEYLQERIGDGNYRVKVFKVDEDKFKYIGAKDFYLGEEEGSDHKSQILNDLRQLVLIIKDMQGGNGNGLHGKIEDAFLAKALNDDPLATFAKIDTLLSQRTTPQLKEPDLGTTILNILGPTVANLLAQRTGLGGMSNIQDQIRLPGSGSTPPLGPSIESSMLGETKQKSTGFNEAFETIFLEPMKNIISGPSEDIAEKIYMMLAYCSTIPEDQIHPIVKEFVIATKNNNQQSAISGFSSLCTYLNIDQAKAQQVGMLIYEMDELSKKKLEEYEKDGDDIDQGKEASASAA